MLEWVKIGIPFENVFKKYQILTGIVSFGVMKKFAYRTEDSAGPRNSKLCAFLG